MKLTLDITLTADFCRTLQDSAQKARNAITALPPTEQRKDACDALLGIEYHAMKCAELLEHPATAEHLSKQD